MGGGRDLNNTKRGRFSDSNHHLTAFNISLISDSLLLTSLASEPYVDHTEIEKHIIRKRPVAE